MNQMMVYIQCTFLIFQISVHILIMWSFLTFYRLMTSTSAIVIIGCSNAVVRCLQLFLFQLYIQNFTEFIHIHNLFDSKQPALHYTHIRHLRVGLIKVLKCPSNRDVFTTTPCIFLLLWPDGGWNSKKRSCLRTVNYQTACQMIRSNTQEDVFWILLRTW